MQDTIYIRDELALEARLTARVSFSGGKPTLEIRLHDRPHHQVVDHGLVG